MHEAWRQRLRMQQQQQLPAASSSTIAESLFILIYYINIAFSVVSYLSLEKGFPLQPSVLAAAARAPQGGPPRDSPRLRSQTTAAAAVAGQ